jgi:hypothetical protein
LPLSPAARQARNVIVRNEALGILLFFSEADEEPPSAIVFTSVNMAGAGTPPGGVPNSLNTLGSRWHQPVAPDSHGDWEQL